MNNKIVSRKITSAIFLAIVLVTGTIALSSPSFMTGAGAQVQPYYDSGMDNDYNSYEPDYGMNNDHKKSYENDNYQSKDIDITKKIKCNNINININNGQGGSGNTTNGNETNNGFKKFNKDGFAFVCINNNNNVVVEGEDNNETDECETCFRTILTEDELDGIIADFEFEGIDSLQDICDFIDENVQTEEGRELISSVLFTSFNNAEVSSDKFFELIECLQEVYDVIFPT